MSANFDVRNNHFDTARIGRITRSRNPDSDVEGAIAVVGSVGAVIGSTIAGAVKGLFWGWVITRFAAPTGHPIKRGALIGAGIGASLGLLGVAVAGAVSRARSN